MNGNEAATYCAYALSEASVVYPITPSTSMGELTEKWSAENKENCYGQPVQVTTMQSEKGVGGLMHGLLRSGVLATTFTCSQGLLLLMPSLYKLSGELLPGVIHVAARSLSTGNLSIYGDHSDVMAVRSSGVLILASSTVQEVAVFSLLAHLLSLKASLPTIHFFDGFDTSHEVQAINIPSMKEIKGLMDGLALNNFKKRALRTDQPRLYGAAQTDELYFQQQEATNQNYFEVEELATKELKKITSLFNLSIDLVDYYGAKEASVVMISMGSIQGTIREVVDEQNRLGKKYGVLDIHLFRPFPTKSFLAKLPKTVKKIVVLDRTREITASSEPLLTDIKLLCFDHRPHVKVIGGRYGLSSKNTGPDQIRAAFFEVEKPNSLPRFTIGINDNWTKLSLKNRGLPNIEHQEMIEMKVWGRGSEGSVSSNRLALEVIGETFNKEIQAKFWFDPRKANNLTSSEIRFSNEKIGKNYRIYQADFGCCFHFQDLKRYPLVNTIKEGGTLVLNAYCDIDRLDKYLTDDIKSLIANKKIKLYLLDAKKIARKYQLGQYINLVMQAVCFYSLFPDNYEILLENFIKKIKARYKMTNELVGVYQAAMAEAIKALSLVSLPSSWAQVICQENCQMESETVKEIIQEERQDGSCFLGMTKTEKIGGSSVVPHWDSAECIQCNLCSLVCPHAAIRPFVYDETDLPNVESLESKQFPGKKYRMQVSPLDCTGCSICADICPKNSITRTPLVEANEEIKNWETLIETHQTVLHREEIKNSTLSQYQQPLLEFSGACSGCGETAYVKLLTQLYGVNLVISNATGCSSIWGATYPHIPYTTNKQGEGPAWGTSLLENNAEYGAGVASGLDYNYKQLARKLKEVNELSTISSYLKKLISVWLREENSKQRERLTGKLILALANERQTHPLMDDIFKQRHFLTDKVNWIIGGDGWAYDIDSDGIDYLISQGVNVNILVLDNGSYANTGGQQTTATPNGSKVKYATKGKKQQRKELAYLTMMRGNAYVAQVCLGASPEQCLRAFKEAVDFDGPSLVIAYSPCLLQGIYKNSYVIEQKKVVESGFWPLFRFLPETKKGFKLESPQPNKEKLIEFFEGEQRFNNKYHTDHQEQMIEYIMQRYKKFKQYRKFMND